MCFASFGAQGVVVLCSQLIQYESNVRFAGFMVGQMCQYLNFARYQQKLVRCSRNSAVLLTSIPKRVDGASHSRGTPICITQHAHSEQSNSMYVHVNAVAVS